MSGAAFVRETRSTPQTGRKGQSNSVLRPREQARMEGEGEAPQALPVEGATLANDKTSDARVSGEAPAALLPEGVLNPNNCSEIEGEAPQALPVEGATLAPSK